MLCRTAAVLCGFSEQQATKFRGAPEGGGQPGSLEAAAAAFCDDIITALEVCPRLSTLLCAAVQVWRWLGGGVGEGVREGNQPDESYRHLVGIYCVPSLTIPESNLWIVHVLYGACAHN